MVKGGFDSEGQLAALSDCGWSSGIILHAAIFPAGG